MDSHYVYIVKCKDESLYTGYTKDVPQRVIKHNKGLGAKYTKIRRPVVLVYQEMYTSKSKALKREYEIKQYSREEKLALIGEGSQ
ncbi:GIY-YIG nuclease family protein [Staphylococcus sp. SQ8-PEA]|uniref:GIY-YIG nuclease family protein n=1 Tax=Staphylococcus marylandisciuri TaxID=2981529 RepID=A0ABT2QSV9_9STAP|nr:GIY-YIG nuclease family protein [Staphylococcus marylandisciuri]MCU5747055.1 GIY-YIG nuclease family protein [Staphylococcus marylandisciuri]